MAEPQPLGPAPRVAVVIPALNEAGKIGPVLDKIPGDGRLKAIVVDDGSTGARVTRRGRTALPSWYTTRFGVASERPSATAGRPGWRVGVPTSRWKRAI
jgi:hypothetical protein